MIDEGKMMTYVFLVYLIPILFILLGVTSGQGDLRLQDGGTRSGRLEIFYNGQWGTVCNTNFGEEEARVACRQLGLDTSVVDFHDTSKFGEGTGTIWLDGLNCNGWESTLESCGHNSFGSNNCSHSEDVGISCGEFSESGDLRLQDGGTSSGGRLEIFYNGEWGTVCDDNFGVEEARVACGQLGLVSTPVEYFDSSKYGEGTGTIWLDEVLCGGWESTLESCSHNGFGSHDCSHSEDVGISCGTSGSESGSGSDFSFWGGVGRWMGGCVFAVVFIVACAGSMYKRHMVRRHHNNGAFVQPPTTAMVHVPPSTNNPGATPMPIHAPPPQPSEPRPYPVQTYSPVYPPTSTAGAPSPNSYPAQAYPPATQRQDGQAPPYPTNLNLPPVEVSGAHPPQGDAAPYPPPSMTGAAPYPPQSTEGAAPPVYPPQSSGVPEGDLPPPPSYNDIIKQ